MKRKMVCSRHMRIRIDAIQRLKSPTTLEGCRSFAGVVNFLSLFCPALQKLLKPIYYLTRKGITFHWGTDQQETFD